MNFLSKTLLSIPIGLACLSFTYAQTGAPQGAAAQMNINILAAGASNANVRVFDNRYQGVKGNPYFLDQWVPGELEIKSGNIGKTEVLKNLQLKYDAYSKLLVAIVPNTKDTLQLSTDPILSFTLALPNSDSPTLFKKLKEAQENQSIRDSFFAILYEGKDDKLKLVKNVTKKKIEANFKGPYSSGQTYDEIVDETQYYIVANGKMQKVKLSKKAFMDAFPQQEAKLKAYISAEKLAMNSEKDFLKALTFLETN